MIEDFQRGFVVGLQFGLNVIKEKGTEQKTLYVNAEDGANKAEAENEFLLHHTE